MDTDNVEDHDIISLSDDDSIECKSQNDSNPYQFNKEPKILINDDDDSLSATSISKNLENKNKLKKSFLIKTFKQKLTVADMHKAFTRIGIPDKQTSISQNNVSTGVINTNKNENSSNKIYSPVLLSNTKNPQPFSILSSATTAKPTVIISKLSSKSSYDTRIDKIESSKPKHILQTISSSGPKLEAHVDSHNGINDEIRKTIVQSNGHSLNYNFSTPSDVKVIDNASETSKLPQDNQLKTAPKFVARMQRLPDGKYKVVPSQGKVPDSLENLFKRNSYFIKHKMIPGSTSSHTSLNTKNIELRSHVSSGNSPKPNYFGRKSRNIKLVPHTATSKDAIENLKNMIDDGQVQKKIRNQELSIPPDLISSSKSQQDDQSFDVTGYDKTTKNVQNTMQVSINKSKNLLTQPLIDSDGANCSINTNTADDIVNGSEVAKHLHPNQEITGEIKKGLEILTDEDDDDDDNDYDIADRFVFCHHKYCHVIIYKPELIDGLYCSKTCKKKDTNQTSVIDEFDTDDEKDIDTNTKSVVVQNSCLSKLEDKIHCKIHKRKPSFTTPCLEKKARNDDRDGVEHTVEHSVEHPVDQSVQHRTKNTCSDLSLDENKSSESISDQIKTAEVETEAEVEDEDEDMIFDLKKIVTDKTILNYMEEMQFRAASNHLFDKPFPSEKNLFKVGQKLEGIDPEHKSLFCVLTIVQVCGYRIKLHFDGYPENYNFWANADCPDLFYPGWCEENSRILQPPKYYIGKFDWTSYLKAKNAYPAPKKNFASTKILANCKKHLFLVGDKLEVLDVLTRTLPKQIVCVGTIADIIGNRIRVHYDGWTDNYDYWMDMTSTNIHPVGWCKKNGRSLARPSGYNDQKGKKPFSWTRYLRETSSKPVPEEAFVPRPLRDFDVSSIIEVVDIACPSLLRTAEIINVRGDELKILYDGFEEKYAYWVEDDSPDIHPVGWSIKTNHPIEIPADENDRVGCRIQGCNGKGNVNSLNAQNHNFLKDCPYEFDSWENSVTGLAKPLDRLKSVEILKPPADLSVCCSTSQTDENEGNTHLNTIACEDLANHKEEKMKRDRPDPKSSMKHTDSNNKLIKFNAPANINKILCNDICLSFGFHTATSSSTAKESKIWTKHNSQLGVPIYNTTDARKWTCLEVATYVDQVVTNNYSHQNVQGNIDVSKRFLDQEIDGEAFLMLTQREIMDKMKIPFGPSLKIHSSITMLKQRVSVFDLVGANPSHSDD